MSKPVNDAGRATEFSRYSQLAEGRHDECLRACRDMTDAVYEGLDVEREIRAVEAQRLGDTVLVWDAAQLVAWEFVIVEEEARPAAMHAISSSARQDRV